MHKSRNFLNALMISIINGSLLYLLFKSSTPFTDFQLTLVFTLVSLCLIFILLSIFSRVTSKFIQNINANLNALNSGNFTSLKAHRQRGLNILETNTLFFDIRDMLNRWIIDLLHSSVAVKTSSDYIETSTNKTFEGIKVLNQSLSEIRDIFEETTHMLTDISSTTIELANSSTFIAEDSKEAVQMVKESTQLAKDGGISVSKMVTSMNTIDEDVHNAKSMITKLETVSTEIGDITNTISGISEQTNLLALNAAIEAARAGDHGRGFAVVADEVRKLADESHKAAQKIDELIQTVQSEVRGVVSAIDKINDQVESGVTVARGAGQNLEEIIQAVDHVEKIITRISNKVTTQSQNTENISSAIQEITSQAQTGTASVEEISNVVEVQLDFLHQNTESSKKLRQISNTLDDTMALFDTNIGLQMLDVSDKLRHYLPMTNKDLVEKANAIGLTEIHLIDEDGFIKYSSNSEIIGFQFSKEAGSQTYEFMKIFDNPSLKVNQKSAFRDVDGRLFKYCGLLSKEHKLIVQCGLEASELANFKGVSVLS